jgi:uncharacterized protein involved in response to NO
VLLVAAAVAWASFLLAGACGRPWASGLPAIEAHGLAMTFGFMPSFFAGFLFTMAPKWLRRPPLPAAALAPTLVAQAAGWLVFALGAQAQAPRAGALAALGLGLAGLGWALAWARLVGVLHTARGVDRAHLGLVALAGLVGVLALGVAAAALALDRPALVRGATWVGVWIFVGGTFAAAAHRMIPFLGSALPALDERHPHVLLHALFVLFAIEGAIEGAGAALAPQGGLPPGLRLAQAFLEAGAGVALLALWVRWRRVQGARVRFVAMLQAGVAWLGVSFVLAAASHAGAGAGGPALGAAPLHAYTMGFLGTTMLAMVTRVACAHAGRAVVADAVLWRLFLLLQATVLARVGGGVLASSGVAVGVALVVAAACGWALAWGAWALRVLPWLARGR